VWPSVLAEQSQPVCCRRSAHSFPAAAPTVSAAVTLYGFGHLFYADQQALTQFSNLLGVKLKFRTFAPDAVIVLLAGGAPAADYWVIFLDDGRLRAHIADDAGYSTFVDSQQTYNTGDWYQVSECWQSFARDVNHQVSGFFAPLPFRPLDDSPPGSFASWLVRLLACSPPG